MGQLVAREASQRLNVPSGIVDLSLAPYPASGGPVARILKEMGLERCGTHGHHGGSWPAATMRQEGRRDGLQPRGRPVRRLYPRQ